MSSTYVLTSSYCNPKVYLRPVRITAKWRGRKFVYRHRPAAKDPQP